MFAVGGQNTLSAFQNYPSEEASGVISLPEQASLLWEDLGLCDIIATSSSVISCPSATNRVVHRSHGGNVSVRTVHSLFDDFNFGVPISVVKSKYSASLALPMRSADYYVYSLNRLRC